MWKTSQLRRDFPGESDLPAVKIIGAKRLVLAPAQLALIMAIG